MVYAAKFFVEICVYSYKIEIFIKLIAQVKLPAWYTVKDLLCYWKE